MKKAGIRSLFGILLIFALIMSLPAVCLADGGALNLKTRNQTVQQGAEFRIVVEVTADTPSLSSFGLEMLFDSSIFTYKSSELLSGSATFAGGVSGNVVSLTSYGGNMPVDGATYLAAVYFTASKKGTGTFKITQADGFAGQDLVTIPMPTGASISVTVTDPVVRSGNNDLKALDVDPGSLTPAFSAQQTSYSVQVADDVAKLVVSATPASSKASVKISGNTDLQPGENKITIVVTAENGNKKTYTILATKGEPLPSPSPSPSPSPTPAISVELPDGTYSVINPPADVPVPAGFYKTLTELSGRMVTAFKALKGDLTLFYLSSEGGDAGFYYFDSQSATYLPYLVLTLPAQSYSVLKPESGVAIPDGYAAADLILNGESISAWQKEDAAGQPGGKDIYLVYLMDSRGDKGFYLYNKASQLLSLYQEQQPQETTAAETTAETTAAPDDQPGSGFNPWQLVAILLGLLCLILLGLVIWFIVRGKNDGPDDGSGGHTYGGRPKRHADSWGDREDDDRRPPTPKTPPIKRVD